MLLFQAGDGVTRKLVQFFVVLMNKYELMYNVGRSPNLMFEFYMFYQFDS